jgi:aminopeptidase
MLRSHVEMLEAYGELAVRVGLNLQPGQRLFILGPLAIGGASLESAPLVRRIAASAYSAGASLVEVLWGDEGLYLERFRHAPRESFGECSQWFPRALVEHVEGGGAVISVSANDPDLVHGQPVELISAVQQATARAVRPFRELVARNDTNWTVVAAAVPGWAAKVFPSDTPDAAMARLWEAIARFCRLDRENPVEAWHEHLSALAARRDFLNARRYAALRYRAPGTDLTIGLPTGHTWMSGQSADKRGHRFTANLPTEEVFTMPHKDHVHGTVRSTKPLSYGGALIEDFELEFEGGRVVRVAAKRGQDVLQQLVDTDPGAARLGEVALVPQGSPIAQSALLFYNTLFDENAASHVALGAAYRFTMTGGESLSDEAFEQAGGNRSAIHVDFMIGSGALDIDGVGVDGATEALMRAGEWASPL